MKNEILKRGFSGALIGLLICHIISIWISLLINDGSYYSVVPELINLCKNETNAVIMQTICALLYGAVWGGITVIWEIDEWSLLKQTVIHFLISSVVTFPIAYVTRWMQHTIKGMLSYFGIFAVIYIIIWVSQYLNMKKKIQSMNAKVRENAER